jgi:hypothetical protein
MGEGVTILAAVEAQVATGAVVVILVLVTVDKVVGVGVGVGVGVDDVFGGSGNAGGVPDHLTQYSLPTSSAEQTAPGLKLRN